MKYRGIFEYEYPTEHKPPVSIDVYLHGDCVKGKIIEWEYRPLEQEPKIGHWIERHDDWGNGIITDRRYMCSVCRGKHIDPEIGEWLEVFIYKYPFCPNCGAKMVEPHESEG